MKEEKENLIDYNIKININKFPKLLRNIIKELEEYERNDDWVMYSGIVEGLESGAKQCMLNGTINKFQYEQLLKRYRRYL